MIRVLAFTRYGPAGPSSRVRLYQFIPRLAEAGIAVTPMPLLDDNYIARLYQGGGRSAGNVLSAYARRIASLGKLPAHDVIWIEKELLPYVPGWLERGLLRSRAPAVVDYDDAIFHNYDLSRNPLVRTALGRKIDGVMARADLVTAGSPYLIERARAAGAREVVFVPSVVDVENYIQKIETGGPVAIGWIGSPSTSRYLDLIRAPLDEQVAAGAEVRLIGAGADSLSGLPVERIAWTAEGERPALAQLDIGVMPLVDTPWERGKCGYKIIQYMAAGLPVVASAVGANIDIVEDGITGFLADSEEAWRGRLSQLAQDPELRRRMGAAGRARALAIYSLEAACAEMAACFSRMARA